jgi:high-affinity Fe2+/Pb2+ permease
MSQKRRKSLLESVINSILGLITSFLIQIFIYNLLNIEVRIDQNILITIVFFTASILRNYIIRRLFN